MRHWLIAIRKNQGLNQYEVAKKANISQSYYAEIETGAKGKALKVPVAKAIAEVLGFEWTKFYEGVITVNENKCDLDALEETIDRLGLATSNLLVCAGEVIDPSFKGPVTKDALYFVTTSIEQLVEQLDEQFSNYKYSFKKGERSNEQIDSVQ